MKVLIIEPAEISKPSIQLLIENGIDVLYPEDTFRSEEVQILFIKTYTIIDRVLLNNYPNLRFILRAGVGLDNVDLSICKEKNITVINAPGSNTNAVAEYLLMVIFMLLRKYKAQIEALDSGRWRDLSSLGVELESQVVGLVGCGAIGQLVALKLHALGVSEVIGYDPFIDKEKLRMYHIKKTNLNMVLKNSDIISLHLPLLPTTKNLISYDSFRIMKKTANIINSSRGGIINEQDLLRAVTAGEIMGAALDVFENEPNINQKLLASNKVITTPHIAGFTASALEEMSLAPVVSLISILKSTKISQ